jgi:hypothetical protein
MQRGMKPARRANATVQAIAKPTTQTAFSYCPKAARKAVKSCSSYGTALPLEK